MITPGSASVFLVAGRTPRIGEFLDGGYFAGYISHTENGVATHGLIVAPASSGATGTGYPTTTNLRWKSFNTSTANTTSRFDGLANTNDQIAAGIDDHPAAKFCVNLVINGYSDWYLPAPDELNIAYYNLKPTTASNVTDGGANPYSVPKRDNNFTASDPPRTNILLFQSGQAEAFSTSIDYHWTSEQVDATNAANLVDFKNYNTTPGNNTLFKAVRAFRRFVV
jgi:hypothetical protein